MSSITVNVKAVIAENKKRLALLAAPYDPMMGTGSFVKRMPLVINSDGLVINLPVSMVKLPFVFNALQSGSLENFIRRACNRNNEPYTEKHLDVAMHELMELRLDHDFEYWCIIAVKITDKDSGEMVPFKLNLPQRKLTGVIEAERLRGVPIRIIITKARQWGGSTLIQMYFAWVQNRLKKGWGSVIVTHVENQARNVRNMYTKFSQSYPKQVGNVTLKPYEGSNKTRVIEERGCVLDITSVESPESTRSFDYALAHLSEAGLWRATLLKKPEDMLQNIRAGIKKVALSMIAIESTPKGVGNFFHREWIAAKTGKSGYVPFFMPWHQFEKYMTPFDTDQYPEFISNMTPDDWHRWNQGATLEGILWYNTYMASENYDKWRMESEFPGDDDEAFQSTGNTVFHRAYLAEMAKFCTEPEAKGALEAESDIGKKAFENIHFVEKPGGNLWIWAYPDKSISVKNRYVVSVDIGGTTKDADWSFIRVFDRYWLLEGGVPEAVASWRGHVDQDLLAWIAAQIAYWYNKAMLVVESNSLTKDELSSEGDHFLTVLDEIAEYYDNLYTRTSPEKVREGAPVLYGFHINKATKQLVIDGLKAKFRDAGYIERDMRVINEARSYQRMEDGKLGAVDGMNDDGIMATAEGLYVSDQMDPPVEFIPKTKAQRRAKRTKYIGEATF
jgi:hypothetical protein